MGSGVAQVCALAGLSVVMIDADEERAAHRFNVVASGLDRVVKKAKLSATNRNAALGRLRGTTDYGALGSCDFIIEAEMVAAGELGRKSRRGFYTYG